MIERAIRNLHSDKPSPPMFCKVIVKGEEVYLECKNNKKYETIPWEDVVYQVEAAKKDAAKK